MGSWNCSRALKRHAAITASPPNPLSHSSWACNTIHALLREHTGRMAAARDRAMGRIPAVIHTTRGSPGEEGEAGRHGPTSRKLLVTTSEEGVLSLMRRVPSFCSTSFGLQVRATPDSRVLQSGIVLPLKVHKDETTGRILNLVLQWVEEGSKVKLHVPIIYHGMDACLGLQKGGYLNRIRKSVSCLCPVDDIPPAIQVDLTNLDIGDRIQLKDVALSSSMELLVEAESTTLCEIVASNPD